MTTAKKQDLSKNPNVNKNYIIVLPLASRLGLFFVPKNQKIIFLLIKILYCARIETFIHNQPILSMQKDNKNLTFETGGQ